MAFVYHVIYLILYSDEATSKYDSCKMYDLSAMGAVPDDFDLALRRRENMILGSVRI